MPQYRRKSVMVEAIKLPKFVEIHLNGGDVIRGSAGDYLVCADGALYACTAEKFVGDHEVIETTVS